MGFWEIAGEIAKGAGNVFLDGLERDSARFAKDKKHFNEQQRQAYKDFGEGIHSLRHRNDSSDDKW